MVRDGDTYPLRRPLVTASTSRIRFNFSTRRTINDKFVLIRTVGYIKKGDDLYINYLNYLIRKKAELGSKEPTEPVICLVTQLQ